MQCKVRLFQQQKFVIPYNKITCIIITILSKRAFQTEKQSLSQEGKTLQIALAHFMLFVTTNFIDKGLSFFKDHQCMNCNPVKLPSVTTEHHK